MQTFLPYADFLRSAQILDMKRLGKQRVETLQLLGALTGYRAEADSGGLTLTTNKTSAWYNHPATLMWSRHPHQLIFYGTAICLEWRQRGYRDTCLEKINLFWNIVPVLTTKPAWLGNDRFHESHQSNLVRKNPTHYQFNVSPDLPYLWPTPVSDTSWKLRVIG